MRDGSIDSVAQATPSPRVHTKNAIPLSEAAKFAPGRPSTCAVWRWCRVGIRTKTGQRVKLSHIRVGGRLYTSKAALNAFFAAVAEADAAYFSDTLSDASRIAHSNLPTPKCRQRQIDRANAELSEAGF